VAKSGEKWGRMCITVEKVGIYPRFPVVI
jgi:hypothetical protein